MGEGGPWRGLLEELGAVLDQGLSEAVELLKVADGFEEKGLLASVKETQNIMG